MDENENTRWSKYDNGTFISGYWYCCSDDLKAKRLTVGKDGPNKGQRYLICPKPEKCGFWLWEEHEDEAEAAKTVAAGQKPRSTQLTLAPQSPLKLMDPAKNTPKGTRPGSSKITTSHQKRTSQTLDSTPWLKRRKMVDSFGSDDSPDLCSEVLDYLKSQDVQLRPVVEAELRHMIGEAVGTLQSKLQNLQDTKEFLSQRLDELDKDRGGNAR